MTNTDVNIFLDLLGKNDLAIIIGQKGGQAKQVDEDSVRPLKKYLVITQIINEQGQKVHYPMPLSLVETDQLRQVDRDTMKLMISRMARTLQASASYNSSRAFGNTVKSASGFADDKTVTARSFFSKENQRHPAVRENQKLKSRLKMVHQIQEQKSLHGDSELSAHGLSQQQRQL